MSSLPTSFVPFACLIVTVAVFIWSGIDPYDRFTWWMEIAPVLIALPVLLLTWKRFRLTNLLYALIAVHAVILMVGGHYTYARVPVFDFLRDYLDSARNSYDGLGHLAQGFIPAIAARELILRTSPLRPGKWLSAILIFSCLGISAIYEIIEWAAAVWTGENAEDFLGAQGDPWDTQKDMALAGVGAILALVTLGRVHDRSLEKLKA
jgi:putative membrane protein